MNAALLAQVKRKLNITWEDADTEARLEDIINTAIPVLIHKLGISDTSFDFSVKGAENGLFLAYCLYEWNHSTNEFDTNYANEIAQIRARYEVESYLASVAGSEGTDE